MRITKDLEHGTFFRHFNVDDKDYLTISCMLYVDLLDTTVLGKASDMWKAATPFLREDEPLDNGLPKSKAEFIAYGSAYSELPTHAQEVGIKVGTIAKKLYVTGDRYYIKDAAGYIVLSEPESFTKKKVGFINAYGGKGYKPNPIGTGYFSATAFKEGIKAPNIQVTEKINLDSRDSIKPESFEPISITWEFRSKKFGTYDKQWQKERWPYFAKDMDYTIFNTTLSDQWNDTFFNGREEIVIENMHKTHPSLRCHLPGKTVKMFVLKVVKDDYYSDEVKEEKFLEVESHIDTVILFTDIAKAVVIYRGVVESVDEEYSDIKSVFLHTEAAGSERKPLAYYQELYERKIDKGVSIDEVMGGLQAKLKKTSKELSLMPMKFEQSLKKLQGTMPSVSPSPKASLDHGIESFKKMQISFDDIAQNGAIERMASKYPEHADLFRKGRISQELDVSMRKTFGASAANLRKSNPIAALSSLYTLPQQILGNIKAMEAEVPKVKVPKGIPHEKDFKKMADFSLSAEIEKTMQDAEDEHEAFLINSWEDGASFFVGDKKLYLERFPKELDAIQKTHLTDTVIDLSNVCYNSEPLMIKANRWKQKEDFTIPKGFVLPFFEKDQIKKLVIRPVLFDKHEHFIGGMGDIEVKGSNDCEFIIEGKRTDIVVLVADFFEAWLLYQEVWDFATVMLIEDEKAFYGSKFFKENEETFKHIYTFYFAFEKKNEKVDYSRLEPKINVIEDFPKVDYRAKIVEALEKGKLKEQLLKEEAKKKRMGLSYIPSFDSDAYAKKMSDTISGQVKSEYEKNQAEMTDDMKKIHSELAKQYPMKKDFIDKSSKNALEGNSGKTGGMEGIVQKSKDQVQQFKEMSAKSNGKLPSPTEIDEKMAFLNDPAFAAIANIPQEVDKKLAPVYAMEKNGVIPKATKLRFKKAFGVDMDAKTLKFKTQEEVIEHYGNGYSFENADFSGMELSDYAFNDVNFKGAKLGGVHFKNVHFRNAVFDNADFKGTLFEKTTFKDSSLKKASLTGAEIKESEFLKSDLGNTVFKGTQISQSSMQDSVFDSTTVSDSEFKNTNFNDSGFINALFLKTTIKGSSFDSANLKNALFHKSEIDGCSLREANLSKTTFSATKLSTTDLGKSTLDGISVVKKSRFEKLSMEKVSMQKGAFLEVDIEACELEGSNLKSLYINKCRISDSDLRALNAERLRVDRTHLKNCAMNQSNLMMGSFKKSFFNNVDLSDSNLFSANFLRIKVNALNLSGANLDRTYLNDERLQLIKEIKR